ncbi:MAG: isoprenylcysteine carboxylmethyltransferase family protein [Candidatus Eremiobacteraeota bacterium]|nr:isoprenylcysteine carboxylmethyltransferase family protein [Candidatus Eremiobacteraeota bacterium]
MRPPSARAADRWRAIVFKNRGLLLVPVALVLVIFGRPTLISAAIGIAIAALGELLRIWAVGYSGVTTRADVVTAPKLVTAGPYSYVRNPLYVGNALTALGFWLAFSGGLPILHSALMCAFVVVFIGGVYATIIPLEEAYLMETFGAPYRTYVARVPRVIPLRAALPASERHGVWRADVIVRAEITTIVLFLLMVAAVFAKIYVIAVW